MEKIIYRIAMCRSKRFLVRKYSLEWYKKFSKDSKKRFYEILPKVPDIGKSIFLLNYKFAPSYIMVSHFRKDGNSKRRNYRKYLGN